MEKDLTKGPITKTLLFFSLPFFVGMGLQFLYSTVDMAIVGRFADASALAAVNTSGQIMTIVTVLLSGLAVGGTVIIGQNVGAGKREKVQDTIHALAAVFLGMSVLLTLVLLVFNHGLVSLTQVPAEAVEPARDYLRICSYGVVFIAFYNGIAGVLRGVGDSRNPMIFIAASCIFNIIGDLVLVAGFRMGAAGAAWATVLAQVLAFVLSVITLQKTEFRLKLKNLKPRREDELRVLKIGLPLGLQEFLTLLSFLLITVIVNDMGDVGKSGGVGVVERIIGLFQLVPLALQEALAAFTAQNVGAGDHKRALSGMKWGILFSLIPGILCFGVTELFPEAVMSLFSTETNVIFYGGGYLVSYGYDILAVCFVFCLNGFFSGYEKSRFTMFNCLCATFLVRVPMTFFISRIPEVSFVLLGVAAPVASGVQVVIQLLYYRFGKWKSTGTNAKCANE